MASRRVERLSQAVRETVSTAVLLQLRDPRIKNVTVLRAEVAGDLRSAKVYVSIRGTEKEQALCLHGLNAARGFLQSKVADRLQTRYTPVLKFVLEDAVSSTAEDAARILEQLEEERRQREGVGPDSDAQTAGAPHADSDAPDKSVAATHESEGPPVDDDLQDVEEDDLEHGNLEHDDDEHDDNEAPDVRAEDEDAAF